jgi:trans-2,3-dihydro-3-hydroxyanthranilate isomerase
VGIIEDPATGSAAAGLGLYLADRIGDIRFELAQGVEMGRPSRILVRARKDVVEIGGRCEPVLRGTLDVLP